MRRGLDIELHEASVQRGRVWALREISWQLCAGERWALVGENGAGKTQLLKLLCGAVWPTPSEAAARSPESRIYRRGIRAVDPTVAIGHMAYLGGESQDKYARYGWNLQVREVIATGLHRTDLLLHPVSAGERRKVTAMLAECRLQPLAERRFLTLSYGERRLTLLARALVQSPDWLLLDEFYNGLDAAYRRRIDTVLGRARRRGQSWVVSAHRPEDIPAGTTQLLELGAGRIVRSGPLRRSLLAPARVASPARPAPRRKTAPGRGLVTMEHVDLYVEHHPVLKDVNWQLRRGEHWAVFGANGSGKSTFLKLLYGDLAPAYGGVLTRVGHPRGAPISEWKQRTGLVSPELQTTYLIDVPVIELVASGRYSSIGLNQPMSAADARAARRWLDFFELGARALERPRELSYGQLRRALIARAMAGAPRLLLLDEPLTGLDTKQRAVMKRLLGRLMHEQITLVAAVHHRDDLPQGMTHELHLHKRRAIAHKL